MLQMVLDGGVLRQRFLPNGKRQTVAVYFRDDVINLAGYVGSVSDQADYLMALQGTVVGEVPDAAVREMRAGSAAGTDGMAVLVLHELSISLERIACLGQRSALERTAHFLCETMARSAPPGANYREDRCPLHVTQEMLSSVLGLSTVHFNRTLQNLRRLSLADLIRNELIVHDFKGLAALGKFDDSYLVRF
jgi:CRP-like cAMP-binding protein